MPLPLVKGAQTTLQSVDEVGVVCMLSPGQMQAPSQSFFQVIDPTTLSAIARASAIETGCLLGDRFSGQPSAFSSDGGVALHG